MRTTVDLDDDVAVAIERLRHDRGLCISEAVDQLARAGLRAKLKRAPFRQRSARTGVKVDVTNIAEAIEGLDGPSAR